MSDTTTDDTGKTRFLEGRLVGLQTQVDRVQAQTDARFHDLQSALDSRFDKLEKLLAEATGWLGQAHSIVGVLATVIRAVGLIFVGVAISFLVHKLGGP
jgi:hypothetical protein